jgi:N-acetylmuramoyl-L-alanine amidase
MTIIMPTREALAHTDHFTSGRRCAIDTVVLHATQGTNSLDWLRWESKPPVSCHVLVAKDGTRYRIVRDADTAWHAGYSHLTLASISGLNVNWRSLGLELENLNDGKDPYTEAQLDAAAFQVAVWYGAYGDLHTFRHRDLDNGKADPRGMDMAGFRCRIAKFMCDM